MITVTIEPQEVSSFIAVTAVSMLLTFDTTDTQISVITKEGTQNKIFAASIVIDKMLKNSLVTCLTILGIEAECS